MPDLNDYARAVAKLYGLAPKSVFAAIAVSFASNGGDNLEEAEEAILNEWWALYDNGILTQKPPRKRPNWEEP